MLIKPGVSSQQNSVDRYECMQATQEETTRTTNDGRTTVTNTAKATNMPLYTACMTARGYLARRESEKDWGGPQVQAALNAERERNLKEVCLNPAYAAYFAKSMCSAIAVTPALVAA